MFSLLVHHVNFLIYEISYITVCNCTVCTVCIIIFVIILVTETEQKICAVHMQVIIPVSNLYFIKNAWRMIFWHTQRQDCHGTTSSSSLPSCSHSRNLGSAAPSTECPGENVLPAHHSPCQDFQERTQGGNARNEVSATCYNLVSGRRQADSGLLPYMQESSDYPESFHTAIWILSMLVALLLKENLWKLHHTKWIWSEDLRRFPPSFLQCWCLGTSVQDTRNLASLFYPSALQGFSSNLAWYGEEADIFSVDRPVEGTRHCLFPVHKYFMPPNHAWHSDPP